MAERNQKSDYGYRVPGWLRSEAGLGRCSPIAREPARTTYGLGIEAIERFYLGESTLLPANLTGLNAGSWTAVDPQFEWPVWFSGRRPVALEFSLLANYVTGGGYVALSFLLDQTEVTKQIGLFYTDTTGWITANGTIDIPNPVGGRHTLTLAYRVLTAGSLTVSSGVPVTVRGREV